MLATPSDPQKSPPIHFWDIFRRIQETQSAATSPIAKIRKIMDELDHPALLMVDTISSLASIDYRHDEWGVDVTVAGSQKGLLLPPGLSFNALSQKALEISSKGGMARSYWDWNEQIQANKMVHFHLLLPQICYMV